VTATSPAERGTLSVSATVNPAVLSESARMVCDPEIRHDIAAILALSAPATVTSTWADDAFTCTYRLRGDALVLSVRQSPDYTTARAYFEREHRPAGIGRELFGLGDSAFATAAGSVFVVRHTMTLQVDPTQLPATLAASTASKAMVADLIASDIMGCWNGD